MARHLLTVVIALLLLAPLVPPPASAGGPAPTGEERGGDRSSHLPRNEASSGRHQGDMRGLSNVKSMRDVVNTSRGVAPQVGGVGIVVTDDLTLYRFHRWDYAYATISLAEGKVRLEVRDPGEGEHPGGTVLASASVPAPAEAAYLDLRDLDHTAHEELELTMVLDHRGHAGRPPTLVSWRLGYCNVDLWQDPCLDPVRTTSVGHLEYGGGEVRPETTHIPGGLLGDYYNNRDFTNFAWQRLDQTIDYDWGNGPPGSGVNGNSFSVRWVGKLSVPRNDTYTLYLRIDDGGRLWVNGESVIDSWQDQSPTEHSGQRYLTEGLHDIRIDYYENWGGAVCQFRWSSPNLAKETVPHTALWGRNATNVLESEDIDLPEGQRWDLLMIDTLPSMEGIGFDVLESTTGSPILGYQDLRTSARDVSSITYTRIRLRARWSDMDPSVAPVLTGWKVKWMPQRTWRCEFLTDLKLLGTVGLEPDPGGGSVVMKGTRDQTSLFAFAESYDGSTTDVDSHIRKGEWSTGVPTSNATDVAIGDLDGDGFDDVIFTSGDDGVNATAFKGTGAGFSTAPTWAFPPEGGSGGHHRFKEVVARDIDGDGDVDLAFVEANRSRPGADRVVFLLNNGTGWNRTPLDLDPHVSGTISSFDLGNIDGSGPLDVVIGYSGASYGVLQQLRKTSGVSQGSYYQGHTANSVHVEDVDADGFADVILGLDSSLGGDSHIHFGAADGGVDGSGPDVDLVGGTTYSTAVTDWNGDGMKDLVQVREDRIRIYAQQSGDHFPLSRGFSMPKAVDVAAIRASGDADGDVAIACSGLDWGDTGRYAEAIGSDGIYQRVFDTDTAVAVASSGLFDEDMGSLRSSVVDPGDLSTAGAWGNLSFRAAGTPHHHGQGLELRVVDADTEELLWNTTSAEGEDSFDISRSIALREHPRLFIEAIVRNPRQVHPYHLDHLELNWTERVPAPPQVLSLVSDDDTVYRTNATTLRVRVVDEFDIPSELVVSVEMRTPQGSTWVADRMSAPKWDGANWSVEFKALRGDPVGNYSFRARVTDGDTLTSGDLVAEDLVWVLNNPPGAPAIAITPPDPRTTDDLVCQVLRQAYDRDTSSLAYIYRWYLDGEVVEDLTGPRVPPDRTAKRQTWSVVVRALDGQDTGPPVGAATTVLNSAPVITKPVDTARMLEDDPPLSVRLSDHFEDPDGDVLVFGHEGPERVDLRLEGGVAVLTLPPDWHGEDGVLFNASDGEDWVTATMKLVVESIPDPPRVLTVGGSAADGEVFRVTATQGTRVTWEVEVEDVDSDRFRFRSDTDLPNFEVTAGNGTIYYTPINAEVGRWTFNLSVEDGTGNSVVVPVEVTVLDVNDPPGPVVITLPPAGRTYEQGAIVLMQGSCSDPDQVHGQVLTFTWLSDIDGVMGHGESFSTTSLSPGGHMITLEVSDGNVSRESSVRITVLESTDGPGNGGNGGGDDGPFVPVSGGGGLWALLLVVVIIVAVALLLLYRQRRQVQRREGGPVPGASAEEDITMTEGIPLAAPGGGDEVDQGGTDMRSVMLGSTRPSERADDELPSSPWSEEELRVEGVSGWEEEPPETSPGRPEGRRPPPPSRDEGDWEEI